jgi:hypothetical protein
LWDHASQIDGAGTFYDFWESEYGDASYSVAACAIFADTEIVELDRCGDISAESLGLTEDVPEAELEEEAYQPSPHLSYGDQFQTDLGVGEVDAWRFEGRAGDPVRITMEALDDFEATLQLRLEAGDRWVADDDYLEDDDPHRAVIEGVVLPEDGMYLIYAEDLYRNGGRYWLSLEKVDLTLDEPLEPTVTDTPRPTDTPIPTDTPEPTETPVPEYDLEITLEWYSNADMDLMVYDADGEKIYFDNTYSDTGGVLEDDANATFHEGDCDDIESSPMERIYWPDGDAPPGTYRVIVQYSDDYCDETNEDQDYEVVVWVDGDVYDVISGRLSAPDHGDDNDEEVAEFALGR